ncbi:MAG: Nif3-like dinuclear metal center hexameric protein [Thermoanaerobaculia bacterium]|nr:Nif3-like dinuclear metal center hexameric protein [Thermoanaerobaculia bacterium]
MVNRSGSVARDELVAYLDRLLDVDLGGDVCPNGLQVEGADTIDRLVTAVSACHEVFERARTDGAQAVLVHHGIFWRGDPPELVGFRKRRIAELLAGDLNLLAYHLPLDRHAELGNNILAARRLGLTDIERFGEYEGAWIGYRGRLDEPLGPRDLASRCAEIFGQEPELFGDRAQPIASVAIVSGAAQRELYTAIDLGIDAFVTGESSEWVMNVARESGVTYLAAGHYATERLGIRALGEHVAAQFGIDVDFVDVPNPV